jgi:hypothetical protein
LTPLEAITSAISLQPGLSSIEPGNLPFGFLSVLFLSPELTTDIVQNQ